jgi:hypothetical protein
MSSLNKKKTNFFYIVKLTNFFLQACSLHAHVNHNVNYIPSTFLQYTHLCFSIIIFVVHDTSDPPRLLGVVERLREMSLSVHAKTYSHGFNLRNC